MNKFNIAFGILCLALSSVAMGDATAEFIPQYARGVSPGTPITFSINLIPGIACYDSASLIIGTNASGIDFTFSDDWTSRFSGMLDCSGSAGIYPQDLAIFSSMGLGDSPITAPITLGSVTLYTDGLTNTTCWVTIDSTRDWESSALMLGLEADPVSGSAEVFIAPEPGTILLLGGSLLYGFKRRR